MKFITILILWSVPFGALCSTEIEEATVTLPYSELRSLLERANPVEKNLKPEPAKPPVEVLVNAAHYTVNCKELGAVNVEANFSISNLSDEWQVVPLIQDREVIRSVDPLTAKLVPYDGMMAALLEPKANIELKLELLGGSSALSGKGTTLASFVSIPAAQSSLTVEHDEDPVSIVVVGAVGGDSLKKKFGLPSSGSEVHVKFYKTEALAYAKWNGAAQYLVREQDGDLLVDVSVRLTAADNGRTTEGVLMLPLQLNRLNLTSDGLERYDSEMTEDGQRVHIRWSDDSATSRLIRLSYTLPVVGEATQWSIGGVYAVFATSWHQAFYIAEFDGIELRPGQHAWSDLGRLPRWIDQMIGLRELNYISMTGIDRLELRARIVPRLEISEATILEANYVTQLVSEGGRLHQASLRIEHSGAASYAFKLPESARLLACAVGGRKIEPMLEEGGGLSLVLPKPKGAGAHTVVTYTYTGSGEPFHPVEGNLALSLPDSELFVHRLKWAIQLPAEFEATALEGNVVIAQGCEEAGSSIVLSKQIYHEEAPVADLYYTRRDLNR